MPSYYFNGPEKDGHIALIGGPYATLEEAKANKSADEKFVEECGAVRFDPWWTWYSIAIDSAAPVTTLRQRLSAHDFVAPTRIPAPRG